MNCLWLRFIFFRQIPWFLRYLHFSSCTWFSSSFISGMFLGSLGFLDPFDALIYLYFLSSTISIGSFLTLFFFLVSWFPYLPWFLSALISPVAFVFVLFFVSLGSLFHFVLLITLGSLSHLLVELSLGSSVPSFHMVLSLPQFSGFFVCSSHLVPQFLFPLFFFNALFHCHLFLFFLLFLFCFL